jgi:hypothetical protein
MTKLTQRLSRSEVNSEIPVVQPSEQVAAELAGQKDAGAGAEKTAPVNVVQNASRENVVAGTGIATGTGTAKPGGKIRKEKGGSKKKTGQGQKAEERDCVVM